MKGWNWYNGTSYIVGVDDSGNWVVCPSDRCQTMYALDSSAIPPEKKGFFFRGPNEDQKTNGCKCHYCGVKYA